jgi:hypothetical protein
LEEAGAVVQLGGGLVHEGEGGARGLGALLEKLILVADEREDGDGVGVMVGEGQGPQHGRARGVHPWDESRRWAEPGRGKSIVPK